MVENHPSQGDKKVTAPQLRELYAYNETRVYLAPLDIIALEILQEREKISFAEFKRSMIRQDDTKEPTDSALTLRLRCALDNLQNRIGHLGFSYIKFKEPDPVTGRKILYYSKGQSEESETTVYSNPLEKRVMVNSANQSFPVFEAPPPRVKPPIPEPLMRKVTQEERQRVIDDAPPSHRKIIEALFENDGIHPSSLLKLIREQRMNFDQVKQMARYSDITLKIFPDGTFIRVTR